MFKLTKYFLSVLFLIASGLLFFGCGQGEQLREEKSVSMTVPLVQDCSQGVPPGAQTSTLDGRCVVLSSYSSQVIQLPYEQANIESIKLNMIDPSGQRHQVGQLNGDINTIQVGNYIFITDINNPNKALARMNIRGNQAFAEINLHEGNQPSYTVANVIQSYWQTNPVSAQMEFVFTKKK